MIETLRIERIAIVEEAELRFGPGLNVLTGETGAGKSIVLGALDLLVGGRASEELLRVGADTGAVEAVFRTEGKPELEQALRERGLWEQGDDQAHEVMIARTIQRGGRSRGRVGGRQVPVTTLDALFRSQLEISSQRGSQALLEASAQGRMLDAFAGQLELRKQVASEVAAIQALGAELSLLRSASEENSRRLDFLRFQLAEIDGAELEAGELERLASEQKKLAHADRLRQEGAAVASALLGDPAHAEAASAADVVASARKLLDGLEQLDPALRDPAERLRVVEAELRDVAADVERSTDGIDADPARLERVEERLAQIDRLRRKYGDTIDDIVAERQRVAGELAGIEGSDDRVEQLVAEVEQKGRQLKELASKLSGARAEAAGKLGREVQRSLRRLELPQARFGVTLEPIAPPAGLPSGPNGLESAEFGFSANKGEPLQPLRRVASGGELSRVFLAVKGALRRVVGGAVLVFDEVDAGMGGRVAERIGRALAELAEKHQVLCITHLPQVAAFAHVHFRVEKVEQGGRTVVRIERVVGDERVEEIARMAGGQKVSDATRSHARELLRASASASSTASVPSGP